MFRVFWLLPYPKCSSFYHFRCLIRYSFLNIIQVELDDVATQWNDHSIRHQANLRVPTGIPNVLYHLPQNQGKCFINFLLDYSVLLPVSCQKYIYFILYS